MKRRRFLGLGASGAVGAAMGQGAAARAAGAADPGIDPLVAVPSAEGKVNRTAGRIDGGVFHEAGRRLPVDGESDVIVSGGGPAGIAAALASARAGARTTLLEVHGCLGGVWTAGMLGLILDSANKGGIMQELVAGLDARGGRTSPSKRLTYHPEIMKWLLEELCTEAGVRIRYFTRVVGAIRENRRLAGIVSESKAGRQAWTARTFVDCTGDGDLAAQAGCAFDVGRDEACTCQPMSLMALITGLEYRELGDYALMGSGTAEKDALRELLVANGVRPSYAKPSLFHLHDDLFALMANHEYGVSAFDPGEVTAATIRARNELHDIVGALRKAGGPWSGIEMVATGAQIGIREGRRIRGRYHLTAEDLEAGRPQPDAVAKVTFPVDVHALDRETGKTSGYSGHGIKVRPYDIPLGALIARDVDGLLMAGRCISGDFFAHASYRVTGNAVAMGEAAGKTAAIAARTKRLPHEVDIAAVRGLG